MEDRQLLALMSAIIYASPDEAFKGMKYIECVEAAKNLLEAIDDPASSVTKPRRNSRVKAVDSTARPDRY